MNKLAVSLLLSVLLLLITAIVKQLYPIINEIKIPPTVGMSLAILLALVVLFFVYKR